MKPLSILDPGQPPANPHAHTVRFPRISRWWAGVRGAVGEMTSGDSIPGVLSALGTVGGMYISTDVLEIIKDYRQVTRADVAILMTLGAAAGYLLPRVINMIENHDTPFSRTSIGAFMGRFAWDQQHPEYARARAAKKYPPLKVPSILNIEGR